MTKLETLTTALQGRDDELLSYQINIDNFARAIAKIDAEYSDNPAMQEFRQQLENLLASNTREQLKVKIMRDVIAEQVAELEAAS
jgi:hypothetical protein